MGLLPSTLFERHPSFFCFLFSRTWEVTVRSRWRDHQNNLDTNKIRTKFSNTFLFLKFEFNTYTSILTLGPKQTQPETLTLTITPTQGLTDTMSTFRLFLLDMVRQGGCHAVTLFLLWITFIVSKKCAQRISFFFFLLPLPPTLDVRKFWGRSGRFGFWDREERTGATEPGRTRKTHKLKRWSVLFGRCCSWLNCRR